MYSATHAMLVSCVHADGARGAQLAQKPVLTLGRAAPA